jgi:hypothetical protein
MLKVIHAMYDSETGILRPLTAKEESLLGKMETTRMIIQGLLVAVPIIIFWLLVK